MKKIWKFGLQPGQQCAVAMPADAQLLTVQAQGSALFAWAIVDTDTVGKPEGALTLVRFRVVETGGDFDDADRWVYVSTTQMPAPNPAWVERTLVWHVFRERTQ